MRGIHYEEVAAIASVIFPSPYIWWTHAEVEAWPLPADAPMPGDFEAAELSAMRAAYEGRLKEQAERARKAAEQIDAVRGGPLACALPQMEAALKTARASTGRSSRCSSAPARPSSCNRAYGAAAPSSPARAKPPSKRSRCAAAHASSAVHASSAFAFQ